MTVSDTGHAEATRSSARIALFCVPPERRLQQRQDVLIAADARGPGHAAWRPCRIVDLSELGCRIEGCGLLVEGSMIAITLPGFAPRRARIMWAQASQAGCQFERALPEAVFDHIIHMSDPRARG